MLTSKTEIREIVYGSGDYRAEVELRSLILRAPLGLVFSGEELARDAGDRHLGAFCGSELAGCLILRRLPDAITRMRQVAVRTQGHGVGRLLVEHAERVALALGDRRMILNAREPAVGFYQRLGYSVESGPFTEVTLPHFKMFKILENSIPNSVHA